jgi:hypothetical protein
MASSNKIIYNKRIKNSKLPINFSFTTEDSLQKFAMLQMVLGVFSVCHW